MHTSKEYTLQLEITDKISFDIFTIEMVHNFLWAFSMNISHFQGLKFIADKIWS